MKLTETEKKEISSKLKIFGENSQALSSEFIKVLRLAVSQQNKTAASRDEKINALNKRYEELDAELDRYTRDNLQNKELVKEYRTQHNQIKAELEELRKEQNESRENIKVFNDSISSLKRYTDSFQSEFLSSLSIINNSELDVDEK
ncbi:TPA: hypothetical protein KUM91_001104 [Serratia marcescens]|nr:hypothetical protein [Serratia marcescens]